MSCIDMVKEDIDIAKKVINDELYTDDDSTFHSNSWIYQFSNEDISLYQSYLENKERVLSVTSSGDQVLSSILFGAKKIDCIDISRFPKYYLELKKAAILSLPRDRFLTFFAPRNSWYRKEELDSTKIYNDFNQNMPKFAKLFWDEILEEKPFYDIYDSFLFIKVTNNVLSLDIPYLSNYDLLKQKLKDVEINYMVGDIFSLVDDLEDEYDLVNLSNIIDHTTIDNYQDLIEKFKLTKDGCILSYIICVPHTKNRELNVTWDLHETCISPKILKQRFVTHQRRNLG